MTLTEDIRQRLRDYMGACPCCGSPKRSYRTAGNDLGVSHTIVHRFMRGGVTGSDTLDILDQRLPSRVGRKKPMIADREAAE